MTMKCFLEYMKLRNANLCMWRSFMNINDIKFRTAEKNDTNYIVEIE